MGGSGGDPSYPKGGSRTGGGSGGSGGGAGGGGSFPAPLFGAEFIVPRHLLQKRPIMGVQPNQCRLLISGDFLPARTGATCPDAGRENA